MRRLFVILASLVMIFWVPVICDDSVSVRSAEKFFSIHTYTGTVDVGYGGSNGGSFAMDMTVHFDVLKSTTISAFTIATPQTIVAEKVEIDGKESACTTGQYQIQLKSPVRLSTGKHTAHLKYRCEIIVNQPVSARLQIFANYMHAHCYNAWYPVIDDNSFAQKVSFDVNINIPKNWYLIGGWVPKEYRAKPKADGKYRMVTSYDNPYYCKIVAGDYNVSQGGTDRCKVWVYTLKTSNCDMPFYADFATSFYSDLSERFGRPVSGEYIIAAQIGRAGNGQGIDNGFVWDQPSFTRDFSDDWTFPGISSAWVGGMTTPADTLPDSKVLIDSLGSWLLLDHFENKIPNGKAMLAKKINELWKAHSQNDVPLTNEACSFNNSILQTKGALVFRALKGWMGEEKFNAGLKSYFDKYKLDGIVKPQNPTLEDFKSVMGEANGSPIDDFWKTYFQSGSVPIPQAEVTRMKFEGKYIEKLRCKNLEATGFPVTYRIFGLDGKTKDVVFSGKESDFEFEGEGIAGFVNLSANALIPKPGLLTNSLGCGTISSVLAWSKPTIICLDSDMGARVAKWADLSGTNVVTQLLSELPDTPLICVGASAALKYAQNSLKGLPVSNNGDSLTMQGVKIMGGYSTLLVMPNVDNGNLPIIVDTGTGNLPADLSWSGIFEEKDGPNTFMFRNMADGQVSPPKPQILETNRTQKSQKVYDCRFDYALPGSEGAKIIYNGFDTKSFSYGLHELVIDKATTTGTLYLDLSKPSTMIMNKTDRFFGQKAEQLFIYGGKSPNFDTPSGLNAPMASSGDKYEIKWRDQARFMYELDGKISRDWESSTSLLLTGLSVGTHKLRIIFYSDGMLGRIHEYDFASGVKPPALTLESKQVQCRDGKVIIKGKTDPEVTLDPPAKVNADGSFEMTINVDTCPKSVVVKAKNKFGLETSETVTVSSGNFVRIVMQIGSSTATDQSGNKYTLQVPPQIIKGSTYVPMRFVGERLGAEIQWDGNLRKVTYILGSTRVELIIGNAEAIVNGKKTKMPGAAVIVGGKTLVPVRFVAEALGAKVGYESATKTITIEYDTP
jgi:hypothetical protein